MRGNLAQARKTFWVIGKGLARIEGIRAIDKRSSEHAPSGRTVTTDSFHGVYQLRTARKRLSRKVSQCQQHLVELDGIDTEGANAFGQLFSGHGVFVERKAETRLVVVHGLQVELLGALCV